MEKKNFLRKVALASQLVTAAAVLHGDTAGRALVTKIEIGGLAVSIAALLSSCVGGQELPTTEVPFSYINGFEYSQLNLPDQQKIDQADDIFHQAEQGRKLNYINPQGEKAEGGVEDFLADIYRAQGINIGPEGIDPNVIQDVYNPVIYKFGEHQMTIKPMVLARATDESGKTAALNHVLFAQVDGGQWGIVGVPSDRDPKATFKSVPGGVTSTAKNFTFIFSDEFPHMTPFGIVAGSSTNAPFAAGFAFEGDSVDKVSLITGSERITTSIPGVQPGTPINHENAKIASAKLFAPALPFVSPPEPSIETPAPAIETSIPPTAIPATPTEIPVTTYLIEQLNDMSSADKLAIAPAVATVPSDVLVTYVTSLPAGTDINKITWGEKTLTFWDRVVAYPGQVDGQAVTLYYDLESGQWAKKYDSFESLSQIPADQTPDVLILSDQFGDHLIRNKLQYNYDWISQPPALTADGKQIFRDEKGYPKAVFDPATKTWLSPEQADVNVTWEDYKAMYSGYSFVGDDGKTYSGDVFFSRGTIMANPTEIENEIENLSNGTKIIIFNPSGEVSIWHSREEAAQRQREGATVMVFDQDDNTLSQSKKSIGVAYDQYQKGNKGIFVTFNDLGISESQIQGMFTTGFRLDIKDIPKIDDGKGHIVSPVMRMPKIFYPASGANKLSVTISNPDFWLDDVIGTAAIWLGINCVEGNY